MAALRAVRLGVFLLVAAFAGVALIALTQPRLATVTVICVDSHGHPIQGADVSVQPSSSSGGSSGDDTSSNETFDLFSTSAPAPSGWAQGLSSDAAPPSGPDSLSATTDARGRAVVNDVPTGTFTVDASAGGYQDCGSADSCQVSVPAGQDAGAFTSVEGRSEVVQATLQDSSDSMNFDSTTATIRPTDDAAIGLNGSVKDTSIQLSLDKVDLDGLLAHAPGMLVGAGDTNANTPKWPGEFTTVRTWPLPPPGHRDFYRTVKLGKLPEGLYRIVAQSSEAEAEGWLLCTRIGLVRKTWSGHVLAFVGDLTTGQPLNNVPIVCAEVTRQGPKTLAQATTNASGLATFDAATTDEESKGVVIARSGASVAAVSLELSSPGESGQAAEDAADDTAASSGALRSFIYTERPVYRPGQTVYYKGIERYFSAVNGPQFRIPKNQPITVDIRDAQDTLVSHKELTTNAMGSWNGSLDLSTEALTGEYTIHAAIGDKSSEATFVVAAYRKPQFKVTLTFDKKQYVRGDIIHATVSAAYYFGAPLIDAEVTYTVDTGGNTYEDESGGSGAYRNPTAPDQSDDQSGGEPTISGVVRLDSRGQAVIDIPTAVDKDSSEDQTYTLNLDVSDKSGQTVNENQDVVVAQGDFSLSTSLSRFVVGPNQPVTLKVNAFDANTKPVAGVAVRIVTAFQTWPNDVQRLSGIQVQNATTDSLGDATVTVVGAHAGSVLVRASASDKRGNLIRTEDSLWVVDPNAAPTDTDIPMPNLAVILDRDKYNPGDTAHLLINADQAGPVALVTVEGASLYQSWTVPLTSRSTSFALPVRAQYVPGVKVAVCCFSDGQFLQTEQDLTVDSPGDSLNVDVGSNAAKYKPGDPVTLTVSTTDGDGKPEPAEVSVGVVDSAIYAIKEDDADISQAFSRDQGDAVNTGDSDEPLYLGDVDKGEMGVRIRRKLPDTAYWNPVVMTGADGTARVSFTLPDNLTTWRITSFGHTADTAVGEGTGTFVVNKDLVTRIEAPAFLTVGDKATISVVVNNNTSVAHDVQLSLKPAAVGAAAFGLNLVGGSQTVTVAPGGSARADWTVYPTQGSGPASGDSVPVELDATAVSGSLSDGLAQTVLVEPHAATQDTWVSGSLLSRVDHTLTVAPGALGDGVRMRVHLSPTVSGALIPAAEYLSSYPYGTTDSIVSTLMGDLSIARIARGPAPAMPLSAADSARLDDEIKRRLLRLYRFQHDDGSFGWTETDPYHDLWMTSDATYAIASAEQAGYVVNKDALSNALSAVKTLVQEFGIREPTAYYCGHLHPLALAALALSAGGEADGAASALKQLEAVWTVHSEDVSYTDMAVAAMVYPSLGAAGKARSDRLMAQVWAARRQMGALASWTYGPIKPQFAEEPSDATATAWILLAMETLQPADPRCDAVARWFMASRSGDHWELYDTTAVALMALTSYLKQDKEMEPDFAASLLVNGRAVKQLHFGEESIAEPDQVVDVPASALTVGNNVVSLRKSGQGRLYYAIDLREEVPEPSPSPPLTLMQRIDRRLWHPDADLEQLDASGYRIKRVYFRDTSRRNFLWEDTVPAPGTDYDRQDSVLVRLIVDCIRPGSHVIVEEPIPAGCTVTDVSGDEEENWDKWWSYTDVRDDKIVFFIDEMTRGRNEIDYHLQASTPGVFDAMPTQITGTFDPTLRSKGHVARVTVATDR